MDITTIRDRVREILGDVSEVRFSDTVLDTGISLALVEYSQAVPNIRAEEITLTVTSRDQVLDLAGVSGSAAGFQRVVELYHYGAGEAAPPDREDILSPVEMFYAYTSSGSPVVTVGSHPMPAVGDKFYVKYSVGHTLDGLQGADVSTVRADHIGVLIMGGAGYAAQVRAANTLESYGVKGSDALQLAVFADNMLKQFRQVLERLRQADLTQGLPAGSGGWRLDGWDNGK